MQPTTRPVHRRAGSQIRRAAALSLVALLVPTSVVGAGSPRADGPVHAVLDGRPIPMSDVPRLHCQDLAYPEVRCFRTADARDASLGVAGAPDSAALTVNYVTVFDGTYLAGPSMALSQDYPSLGVISWNDRISSMRVWTTSYGYFFTGTNQTGDWYLFCCGQTYNSLGAYDNTFSSVDVPN